MDIDLSGSPDLCPPNDLVGEIHDDHDRGGKIDLKEGFDAVAGRHVRVSDGGETRPKLRGQNQKIHDQTQPRAVDGSLGFERQFVESVAGETPCSSEADVAETDGSPATKQR